MAGALTAIARRHGSRRIGLFGSAARGEDTADSDLDFLSDFENGRSLFDLIHLQEDLVDVFQRPVDVVDVKALNERDDDIRAEVIWL